jgi:two-component system LytT family response regulator
MPAKPLIRVIVVDDEPLAREGVSALISQDSSVDVVQVCASGQTAVKAIVDLNPDIVFLDVQMPGMSGFDVIRTVGVDRMPFIIFTTAYDRYALDAFEAHALEYLLKPFSDERFHEALERGKSAVRDRRLAVLGGKLAGLLESVSDSADHDPVRGPAQRITVRGTGKTYFIQASDIDWIEGADYYANVHSAGRHHLVRETLSSLAARLDPRVFLRVHRSAIVNVQRVKEIRSAIGREAFAILHDGTKVRLARGARSRLEAMLDPR